MSRQEEFDYLFKIVIIGDSGVGKTNLLGRFVDDSFSMDSKPTIGVEFATKTLLVQNKTIKNQIWDTAGQQRFRAITNAYYRGAQGAIVVYDLTKSKTFENIGKWLAQLRENADPDITIMLLGNKTDLEERAVKMQQVEEYVASNKLLYIETSAQSGQNVNEAFNSLIKDIYNKVKVIPQEKKTDTPVKPNIDSQKKQQEKQKPNTNQKKQGTIVLDENKKNSKKPEKKACC